MKHEHDLEAVDMVKMMTEAISITNAEIKFGVFPENGDDTSDMLIENEEKARDLLKRLGVDDE